MQKTCACWSPPARAASAARSPGRFSNMERACTFATSRTPPALDACRKAWPGVGATLADVADPAAVDALFAAVEHELGGLDVLVNNAGIAGPTARVEDIELPDWRRTLAINIDGMFYCTRR